MRMNLFGIFKLYDDNDYLQEISELKSVENKLLILRKNRRILVWLSVISLLAVIIFMIGADVLQLIGIVASIGFLENIAEVNLDYLYWGIFAVFIFIFVAINSEIHILMIRELNIRDNLQRK